MPLVIGSSANVELAAVASDEGAGASTDPDIPQLRSTPPSKHAPQETPLQSRHINNSAFLHSPRPLSLPTTVSNVKEQQVEAVQTLEEHDLDPNDPEAAFICRTKPRCSKTTLVSCLSSRSTSPGPMSPLLSDDDFGLSACGSSTSGESSSAGLASPESANLSRRSSHGEGGQTPRVRFKRGCVITEVNLTWASTSYDRQPIDVAQSLSMHRCPTMAAEEEQENDCERWASSGLGEMSADDRQTFGPSEYGTHRDGVALSSPSSPLDPTSEVLTKLSEAASQIRAPPSPPIRSSPCTAADASYAYATTFGELSQYAAHQQVVDQVNYSTETIPPSSTPACLPSLVHDDTSSGSDSSEESWIPFGKSLYGVHNKGQGYAGREMSFGAAARELSLSSVRCPPAFALDGQQYSPRSVSPASSNSSSRSNSVSEGSPEEGTPRARPIDAEFFASSDGSPAGLHIARSHSPTSLSPPAADAPARKVPRYNAAKFKVDNDNLYGDCDALGGF